MSVGKRRREETRDKRKKREEINKLEPVLAGYSDFRKN